MKNLNNIIIGLLIAIIIGILFYSNTKSVSDKKVVLLSMIDRAYECNMTGKSDDDILVCDYKHEIDCNSSFYVLDEMEEVFNRQKLTIFFTFNKRKIVSGIAYRKDKGFFKFNEPPFIISENERNILEKVIGTKEVYDNWLYPFHNLKFLNKSLIDSNKQLEGYVQVDKSIVNYCKVEGLKKTNQIILCDIDYFNGKAEYSVKNFLNKIGKNMLFFYKNDKKKLIFKKAWRYHGRKISFDYRKNQYKKDFVHKSEREALKKFMMTNGYKWAQ